ncbi:MAG: fatty acyl-AMP ligase [Cyanobacteria bacterium P01_C01_bin.69]
MHLADFTDVKVDNLIQLLQQQATRYPQRDAFIFLKDGETEAGKLTYPALEKRARAIAAQLQRLNMAGKSALMLYPPGLEFIEAFWGCLYAGVVAVPAFPPKRNQKLARLEAMATDAQATLALTTTSVLDNIQQYWGEASLVKNLQWVATNDIADDLESRWVEPDVSTETLAFLQYTSGSTGSPKGVMVSHGNLLHNGSVLKRCFENTSESIGVNWLPHYHDMGLIGGIIQPLYLGMQMTLLPPITFLQKPVRWLRAISKYRATTTGGPNFAYDWCVKRIQPEQLEGLDLSCWKIATNGAEPIREKSLAQFEQMLALYGFRRQMFYPCYGMAETTLLISGGVPSADPVIRQLDRRAFEKEARVVIADEMAEVREFVGCGQNLLTKIAIANPKTKTRCTPNEVGEIWVSGKSVAMGYWQRPALTQDMFHAYFADTGEGPFFRTGDLGFLLEGELFVTGRLKDVMIIRGANYYPQDIEYTVENSHAALRSGSGAAFTVNCKNEEQLVIVQEVARSYLRKLDADAVVGDIVEAITAEHQLKTHAVVLVKPGSIPKTSSGKIQRYACREGFLDSSLQVVHPQRLSV